MNMSETAAEEAADPKEAGKVKTWLAELDSARKREKDFRKAGKDVLALYEADNAEKNPFNILYSNVETLAPALYNNTPRPVVQRRFKDPDPVGKQASTLVQRVLEFFLDTGSVVNASFDDLMASAVLEALLPGRGVTWFKYDAEIEKVVEASEEAAGGGEEASEPASWERVEHETACGEEVPWDMFLHGFARKWEQVPWVAREHFMDKGELIRNFGKEVAECVQLTASEAESEGQKGAWGSRQEESNGEKLAIVYEIWDKDSRKVFFVSPGYPNAPLREVDDPLGLVGFFPCPKPLTFFSRVTSFTPVSLYKMYQEQATELNIITIRINRIIKALKVRGFYDSTVEGIEKVLAADDNTLVPAENVAALQQGQSLDKAIFLMPIDKLVIVLQQLYAQRMQIKQVIYEITGVSDILRGASVASETATAQNIKNQWGTLRLKKMQKAVSRYARECLRIVAEIAVSKLSPETLSKMTNLPFPTAEQKQQASMLMQQLAASGQQPPPEMLQIAQTPSWQELLALLQDDTLRAFRIDIETNSTVDAEATEDKQNVNELLNALAQFFNGVGPLVQDGSLPFDVAKELLLAVVKRFRFGSEVEDVIAKMAPPAPKPDPEQAKNEQEKELEQLRVTNEKVKLQMEAEFRAAEHKAKMEELMLKAQIAQQTFAMKLAQPPANPGGLHRSNPGE